MKTTATFLTLLALGALGVTARAAEPKFTIEQTLSDEAQKHTIAFDALAFLTGGLCADSFLPPGKVSDFFGFQYLRDNDPDEMGHNTDFLTRIANNVLYVLTDEQIALLAGTAEAQVVAINEYAYRRFPLMKAFRRLLDGDLPAAAEGLSEDAVAAHSASLYRLDGEISLARAKLFGGIIRSLSPDQRAYLDALVGQGMLSWPNLPDQIDKRDYTHDVHVAIMTYASEMYAWYAGSPDADVYFCPERQGTYFGSFYLKDMPAMGNPGYSIDPNLTANSGKALLAALNSAQASLVTSLVEIQRDDLEAIVDRRLQISLLLRGLLTQETIDDEAVLALSEEYGALDGRIVYHFATNFAAVGQSLTPSQRAALMEIRDLDAYPCSGAFLYSERIEMPAIASTDFLFDATILASVSGRVRGSRGGCVEGLAVEVHALADDALLGTATTDERGRYTFAGLRPGDYRIVPAGAAGDFTPADVVVTLGDRDALAPEIRTPAFRLRGTVVDAAGDGVADATVTLAGGRVLATAETAGGRGRFRFGPVPEGTYTLTVTAPGGATATRPVVVAGEALVLPPVVLGE